MSRFDVLYKKMTLPDVVLARSASPSSQLGIVVGTANYAAGRVQLRYDVVAPQAQPDAIKKTIWQPLGCDALPQRLAFSLLACGLVHGVEDTLQFVAGTLRLPPPSAPHASLPKAQQTALLSLGESFVLRSMQNQRENFIVRFLAQNENLLCYKTAWLTAAHDTANQAAQLTH